MRPFICAALLVSLSACTPKNKPATPQSASPSSSGSAYAPPLVKPSVPRKPTADDLAALKSFRADEVTAMASHPKYATREGDTLTIYQRDKPVARFTDQGLASCNGDGTCNLWRFDGLVYLRSAAEDRPKPYVAVMGYNGESDIFLLVEPTGELIWLDGPPLASPDGRYLAIGGVDVYQGSSLTIRDQESASPAMVVDFGLTCETLRWTSNTTLRVRCIHDDGDSHTTIASVSQIDATTWQLQETAELDTKSLKPIAHSTLSLKTIAAKTKPRRLPTPEEKANDDLGDKEIGIERLAP